MSSPYRLLVCLCRMLVSSKMGNRGQRPSCWGSKNSFTHSFIHSRKGYFLSPASSFTLQNWSRRDTCLARAGTMRCKHLLLELLPVADNRSGTPRLPPSFCSPVSCQDHSSPALCQKPANMGAVGSAAHRAGSQQQNPTGEGKEQSGVHRGQGGLVHHETFEMSSCSLDQEKSAFSTIMT